MAKRKSKEPKSRARSIATLDRLALKGIFNSRLAKSARASSPKRMKRTLLTASPAASKQRSLGQDACGQTKERRACHLNARIKRSRKIMARMAKTHCGWVLARISKREGMGTCRNASQRKSALKKIEKTTNSCRRFI